MKRRHGKEPRHHDCSECGGSPLLVSGAKVYPHRKDLHGRKYWLCPCGAYVGCHPGTSKPLGSPAGKSLRSLRAQVHASFDPLWARKMVRDGAGKGEARRAAYAWLATVVGVSRPEDCHVGLFNANQCRQALRALQGIVDKNRPEIEQIEPTCRKNEHTREA